MYIDSKGLFEYSNWFRFQENLKQQWYWNWITETYWFRFQEKKKPQTAMILKLGYWIYVTKNRERNWKCNHLVTDSTADWLGRGGWGVRGWLVLHGEECGWVVVPWGPTGSPLYPFHVTLGSPPLEQWQGKLLTKTDTFELVIAILANGHISTGWYFHEDSSSFY